MGSIKRSERLGTTLCPACLTAIDRDSRFCKHCGAVQAISDRGAAAPFEGYRVASNVRGIEDVESAATKPVPIAPLPVPAAASAPSFTSAATPAPTAPVKDVYRNPDHEHQVWSGRPSWRSFYGNWALFLAVSAAALYFGYTRTVPGTPYLAVVWIFILGVGVALFMRELLIVLAQRYRLTTQRLIIHRGLLMRVTDQIELVRVEDVRLRQGVIDRMVNTGDIDVLSSDETDALVTLESVGEPAAVAEALRRHVRGVRQKGTLMVETI